MTANWSNRTLWTGDNLDIMRGMNSESVDLIYLDPPFNSNKNYAAPIGSEAAGVAFKDTWTLSDVDEEWHGEIADREPTLYAIIDAAGLSHGKSMKSYLIMMAVRLLEMRRILKPTGSIYLHCDPTASHNLKTLMDAIFGHRNFRNEIVWHYQTGGASKRWFSKKHDVLLFYSQSNDYAFFSENIRVPRSEKSLKRAANPKGARISASDTTKLTTDVWVDISAMSPMARERIGYPTQKPLALLDRIIKASSNEGDMILDPFAGCATALVAADRLQRQWVGIDLSEMAAKLVKKRLRDDSPGQDQATGKLLFDIHHRKDIPRRTDLGELSNYRTHKHTLYGRQEGHCGGCQVMFPFRNMTVDHVVAQSKGGSDHLGNLQLLCGACNSMKGAGSQEQLVARLKAEGITP